MQISGMAFERNWTCIPTPPHLPTPSLPFSAAWDAAMLMRARQQFRPCAGLWPQERTRLLILLGLQGPTRQLGFRVLDE